MPNILKCKRCSRDIELRETSGKMLRFEKRTRRFCSTDCYETWWNEQRSRRETRSEIAEKILGTPAPTLQLTDVQAAWVAGLIDGEGTIGVWREARSKNRSGYRYKVGVQIANTNMELLNTFANVVRGGVTIGDMRRKNPMHKICYKVVVNARFVKPLLECVAPFLVIKKRQAELALEFRRIIDSAPARTEQEHEIFEQLWLECKALNKRGRM